ncbi:MAG: CoA transferase [Ilumatobacteraceae bacterium]
MTERHDQILDGVRVVDTSWGLAGPVAALLLAEAGADVVKVERPGGDPLRSLHPAAFATWNRSKRSVVLDLEDSGDRHRFDGLLAGADVLIHGFRPSVATRFALDDAMLLAAHPRLVVSAITGYPADHADAERPGWDVLVQARGGLMDIQDNVRPGPFVWRFPAPSWGAAYLATAGIVARLVHRLRSGRGGVAHTSIVQGLHLIQNLAWNRAEHSPPSLVAGQPGTLIGPQQAMYQCGDGEWLQIMNPADRIDISVMPLMVVTRAELGLADGPLDIDMVTAVFQRHASDDVLRQLRDLDVAVELVVPLGSVFDDDEVLVNGYTADVDDVVWGRIRQSTSPYRTLPPSRVKGPAPALDADADAPVADAVPVLDCGPPSDGGSMPLSGVKVVDFGAFLAGPLAPMILSDLGADVVKVEPLRGDPVRGWRDGFYVACNRGKRGIAVDLASPGGQEVRKRLVAWADVVHHNVRTAAAERLGLDEAALRDVNPSAIFSHGSAYGLLGARASWPGYDSVFQAIGGWNVENAGAGNPPLFNHLGTLDTLTGAGSAIATLLALYHRERTGQANPTYSALLNTATFTNSETARRLDDGTPLPYPGLDAAQMSIGPGYGIRQVADGWVAFAAPDAVGVASLATVLDASPPLGGRAVDEVLEALAAAGVAAERVREHHWFDVWDDEENLRTGLVATYQQADWGEMRQFGAYWAFGDLHLQLDRACPALGQHSADVLGMLGFDEQAVADLGRAGAVAGPGVSAAAPFARGPAEP